MDKNYQEEVGLIQGTAGPALPETRVDNSRGHELTSETTTTFECPVETFITDTENWQEVESSGPFEEREVGTTVFPFCQFQFIFRSPGAVHHIRSLNYHEKTLK